MTDQRFAAFMNERSRDRGAIANVDLHVLQRCTAIVNEDEIGRVENPSAPGAYAKSDGRRENRMFDRKRFECDPADFRRRALFDCMAILDRVMTQFLQCLFRRIHRTRRTAFQSPGVSRMELGLTRFSFPSQSRPASIITFAPR